MCDPSSSGNGTGVPFEQEIPPPIKKQEIRIVFWAQMQRYVYARYQAIHSKEKIRLMEGN